VADVHRLLGQRIAPGRDLNQRLGLGHDAPIGGLDRGDYGGSLGLGAGVVQRGLHGHPPEPQIGILAPRVDPHPIGVDRDGIGQDQPGVPVDAGALVPPSLIVGGIHAHRDHVRLVAIQQAVGDIGIERGVPAGVAGHGPAVDPHLRVGGHAVKKQHGALAGLIAAQRKGAAVPADAAGLAVVRIGQQGVEFLRHDPVVRQAHGLPARVVVQPPGGPAARLGLAAGIDRILAEVRFDRGLAFEKLPAPVHQQALTMHESHARAPFIGANVARV